MGTGYTRNDTANNIADGNVINASDLDGEFDALQSAFNGTTGHSHDGTSGEGPQIDTDGIANDAVTLGTKTSGNYVAAGAVSGVGLSGSASAEGATFTVTSNATNANTASTIVARDASGNFSAGNVTVDNLITAGNVDGRDVSADGAKLDGIESAATADQTAAEIRTLVESATDSNVFTDADHTKLNGIEALADVTDTTNVVAALTAGTNIAIAADGTISSTDTNTTYTAGGGLDLSGTTFSHSDTSSQASSNNSGRTYIQDITLDTYGHVTGIATATETVVDTNTTYTANSAYGMTLSGTEFRLGNDRRRNSSTEDVYSGNSHDFTFYDADVGIRWYTENAEEMRLENDGDLHVDGNITAYSTTVSDPRLKTDIEQVTDALSKVEKLNGYTFTYKHDGSHSAGVMSPEVADVLPSAIRKSKVPLVAGHDNETEYDIVQYDQLHALLIEAVKELSSRVKELEDGC